MGMTWDDCKVGAWDSAEGVAVGVGVAANGDAVRAAAGAAVGVAANGVATGVMGTGVFGRAAATVCNAGWPKPRLRGEMLIDRVLST